MSVAIYNTLSRQKEAFKPLTPTQVKMYCCGVTVYDYCHLGHARSYIVWDTIRRYLSWRGYDVRYIQNFTDIDDKILNRARKEKSSMETVAKTYTAAYFEDMARLNILEADEYTYATHTIDGIKRLIHELTQKGYAYPVEGDVYYAVRKFEGYGKLSGRKLDDMEAGRSGRVEGKDTSIKQDPFDFALWKSAKPDEPSWDSPWGPGRPGWHIECSAMVRDRFGDTIDIHVGGADLQFPHHENEIAQSEAATGKPLATYWMHNGMVNVDGTKMSKSLGNFTTIRSLLDAPEGPDPMAVRMFVLQSQYRMPLDFTEEAIQSAKKGWANLNEGLNFGAQQGKQLGWAEPTETLDEDAVSKFKASMDDDFNTPGAIAVLFGLAKELQRQRNLIIHAGNPDADPAKLQQQWQTLVSLAAVLGLEAQTEKQTADEPISHEMTDEDIEALIAERSAAKQAKNYAEADRIRDQLTAKGIALIDKPGDVTTWHR